MTILWNTPTGNTDLSVYELFDGYIRSDRTQLGISYSDVYARQPNHYQTLTCHGRQHVGPYKRNAITVNYAGAPWPSAAYELVVLTKTYVQWGDVQLIMSADYTDQCELQIERYMNDNINRHSATMVAMYYITAYAETQLEKIALTGWVAVGDADKKLVTYDGSNTMYDSVIYEHRAMTMHEGDVVTIVNDPTNLFKQLYIDRCGKLWDKVITRDVNMASGIITAGTVNGVYDTLVHELTAENLALHDVYVSNDVAYVKDYGKIAHDKTVRDDDILLHKLKHKAVEEATVTRTTLLNEEVRAAQLKHVAAEEATVTRTELLKEEVRAAQLKYEHVLKTAAITTASATSASNNRSTSDALKVTGSLIGLAAVIYGGYLKFK